MKLFSEEEVKELEAITDEALRLDPVVIKALRTGEGQTLGMVLQGRRALAEARLLSAGLLGKSAYLEKSELKNLAYRTEIMELEDTISSLQILVYGLYSLLIAKDLVTEKEFVDVIQHGAIVPLPNVPVPDTVQ